MSDGGRGGGGERQGQLSHAVIRLMRLNHHRITTVYFAVFDSWRRITSEPCFSLRASEGRESGRGSATGRGVVGRGSGGGVSGVSQRSRHVPARADRSAVAAVRLGGTASASLLSDGPWRGRCPPSPLSQTTNRSRRAHADNRHRSASNDRNTGDEGPRGKN